MLEIMMLKTEPGSVDGIRTKLFRKGETYTLSDQLATAFVDRKVAEYTTKMESAGYSNKMVGDVENKTVDDTQVKDRRRR